MVRGDMKNAEGRLCRSRYRQEIRSRSANCDILVDQKLAAGQRDGLALECGIESDCIAVIRISKRLTQRAGTAVVCVGNRDNVSVSRRCQCTKNRQTQPTAQIREAG